MQKILSVDTQFKVEFFDVDSMDIVYHGNYVKFLEIGRCALLDKIGYNYIDMRNEGFMFPIVELKVKYIRSLKFSQKATIRSYVTEYENCLKIRYEIYDEDGNITTKAETSQMVVEMATGKTMFVCPRTLIEKVENLIK